MHGTVQNGTITEYINRSKLPSLSKLFLLYKQDYTVQFHLHNEILIIFWKMTLNLLITKISLLAFGFFLYYTIYNVVKSIEHYVLSIDIMKVYVPFRFITGLFK